MREARHFRSSVFIAECLGMILFIFIEDQIGKRKVLVSCLCLTTVGSCVLLASRSMAMAVAGQYIIGFGKFAIISFGMAMISDITKP